MNGRTARTIRRSVAATVPDPAMRRRLYRVLKRDWTRLPWTRRAVVRAGLERQEMAARLARPQPQAQANP